MVGTETPSLTTEGKPGHYGGHGDLELGNERVLAKTLWWARAPRVGQSRGVVQTTMVGTEIGVGQLIGVGQTTMVGTGTSSWAAKEYWADYYGGQRGPSWAKNGKSGHYGGQRGRVGQMVESLDTVVGSASPVGQSPST